VLEAAPADLPRRERDLIDTKYHLGVFLQEHGRFGEGAALTAAALAELVELRDRHPDDIELVVQELNSLYGAQLSAFNGGRHDERRRWLDRLVAVAEDALPRFAADPALAAWRRSIVSTYATGLAQLTNIARDEGRLEEALAIARRRGQACREIVAEYGGIDDVHREAIDADLIAASLCGRLGRPEEAAPLLDAALALAEDVNRLAPAVYDHAILLGRALYARGEFSAAAGDTETALRFLSETLALLEPWLPHQSRSTDAASLVESARNRIASLRGLAPDATSAAATVVNP
jgi:tetratricopeptide (TPR) repeat protein